MQKKPIGVTPSRIVTDVKLLQYSKGASIIVRTLLRIVIEISSKACKINANKTFKFELELKYLYEFK